MVKNSLFRIIIAFLILCSGIYILELDAIETSGNIEGIWRGGIEIPGEEAPDVIFQIYQNADGVLKAVVVSPDQIHRLPVDSVIVKKDSVHMVLKSISGVFKGKLKTDIMTIEGTWSQAGQSFPLILKQIEEIPGAGRPQEPEKPYPYVEEEVIYENKQAGVKLAGTLTYPTAEGLYPAVLLVSGSGPIDRNDMAFGHQPFFVLADYLTRQGIAVLRYDKRGVWKSTGDFSHATTEDFSNDALAGINYLKNRVEINSKTIGIIGHSEGAMIAAMLAAQSSDIAFIVIMAGPGIELNKAKSEQKCLYARAEGLSDENIPILNSWYENFYYIAKTEKDNVIAEKKIREQYKKLTEEEKQVINWSEEKLTDEINLVLSPWWRYLLNYEPKSFLTKVKCSVLAINGEKDLQVAPKENLQGIEEALKEGGNENYTIMELKGLNHVFQSALTGAESEYAMIDETLAPVALKTISEWIKKQINIENK
jgi:alpha/beta superfamily hydrolase